METEIFESPEALAFAAAERMTSLIMTKPNACLCLAAGESPRLSYAALVQKLKAEAVDCSGLRFVSLDEWLGIHPSNSGSCFYFLNEALFKPLHIAPESVHFFNSMSTDPDLECERIDYFIRCAGGLDLILVGIGMNGHIGFNEPGTDPALKSHVVELDSLTTSVGQKYFSSHTLLSQGITLGISQCMEAGTAILLASGEAKAPIIRRTMNDSVSSQLPASHLRLHKNAFLMIDKAAAQLL